MVVIKIIENYYHRRRNAQLYDTPPTAEVMEENYV